MTDFPTQEEHPYSGQPVELYHFDVLGGGDYYYTSADVDQTYLSNVYKVQPGLSRSSTKMAGDGKANEIGVTLPHDHEVALLFKTSLPHSEIRLTIYKRHRSNSDFKFTWQGYVVLCSFSYPNARLSCEPLDGQRDEPVLHPTFQHRCNWKIYDRNCGLEIGDFSTLQTVTAISSDGTVLTVGDLSGFDADYFKGGVVRFGTESHMMIMAHTVSGGSDTVTILAGMSGLVVGDQIRVAAACQGSLVKCNDVFDNIENAFGFRIPIKNIFSGDGTRGDY